MYSRQELERKKEKVISELTDIEQQLSKLPVITPFEYGKLNNPQPIETVPRRTDVFCWFTKTKCWIKCWIDIGEKFPETATHWLPMPPPPPIE